MSQVNPRISIPREQRQENYRASIAMAPGGLQASPELSNDRDSISVNPGSPPSPLPPLDDYTLGGKKESSEETAVEADAEVKEDKTEEKQEQKQEEKPEEKPEEKKEGKLPLLPKPERGKFILDPEGELTHDQTTVDIVTVPCPGGDPLRTWNRDGLMGRYFGALSMRDAEGSANPEQDRPAPSWVRQGIRREADRARILLYEHPPAEEGATLSSLADALLEELGRLRTREDQNRPVVFVGHSIGGIIVKMVLVKASKDVKFEGIFRQCYGVAFLGKFF
ncbi:hypothetical protein BHE90_009990 [Fusarium euwallaceae]|uniref:DUF676 domain-containing protein n=2 Tax=Fusarium solani species complex TaxID=232080 RepID=A0A430LIK1_9HYPO|nr:hypothetical protein CEP51_006235 [Fusarium floridanum]RTE75556.1 hypothetical protein BHE90_009990 [Fusarium euwallaceae]